jgi:2-dehydro-3-deoxy-D-arabinonate dehydratase
MHLVRYRSRDDSAPAVGVLDGRTVTVIEQVPDLAALLGLRLAEIRALCSSATEASARQDADQVQLLVPVDGRTEVWAAGVTYRRSMQARVEESVPSPDIYDLVYGATRPELFFKSASWRATGTGEKIAIRMDSEINVPEPELAVVVNRFGEIVGYTVCNDVSSRSIEGENPLYLPQAKVYLGSCALASAIRPSWEVADPYDLTITMEIIRGGAIAWQGTASTSDLHRRIEELINALYFADDFPDGAVLSTGTCLVPDLPFTLKTDDIVRIAISDIGKLENPVVQGKGAMAWLSARGGQLGDPGPSKGGLPDARKDTASS